MKKKITVLTLCAMLFALCVAAEAQQTGKIFRIGFLDPSNASSIAVFLETFRQELGKLGWIDGKNIIIEFRFAEQAPGHLRELAAELVHLKVDLIVVTSVGPALAAKGATMTSPIVMVMLEIPWV
jgi:putative tryptophan/tyrosine transport system substrate-binding protein